MEGDSAGRREGWGYQPRVNVLCDCPTSYPVELQAHPPAGIMDPAEQSRRQNLCFYIRGNQTPSRYIFSPEKDRQFQLVASAVPLWKMLQSSDYSGYPTCPA